MIRQLRRAPAAVVVALAIAWAFDTGLSSAQRSDTEGIKETENFVKTGGQMSQSVAEAKLSVKNTLDAYNTLVTQPSTDMKADYKRLLKSMREMDEKSADARDRVARMESVGATYFAGRAASIKNIQNPDLRDQATQRLEANQAEFAKVLAALQEAGRALEPIRNDLADQINYLGSDLSPGGVASLRPQAEKLNARSVAGFDAADQAINMANRYFASMRPTKS
jgi:DNA repair ATPase RecN